MIHKQFYYKQHPHLHNLSLTSNDITINILHPHNPQYTTPTNKQIFKYMLYLHFALILVTTLNLCSALKFRTYLCLYQVVTFKRHHGNKTAKTRRKLTFFINRTNGFSGWFPQNVTKYNKRKKYDICRGKHLVLLLVEPFENFRCFNLFLDWYIKQ